MKRIKLTQGQYALVDDIDFVKLSKFKWHALWVPDTKSFIARRVLPIKNGKRVFIAMHRQITNCLKGFEVDHKNHNTLDNQKKNLRICTKSQNAMNRRLRSDSTTGIKGVSFFKPNKSYRVEIRSKGKRLYLGYFKKLEEAKKAYELNSALIFGEFAFSV